MRRVQPATKMDKPVLTPEHPWEFSYHPEDEGVGKRIYVYGTVFFDSLQAQYRIWYMSRMSHRHDFAIPELEIPGGGNVHRDLTLYATSADGIHWEKPNLGLCHFNRLSAGGESIVGDTQNNIMLDFHGASVFLDLEEPDPQKRYKQSVLSDGLRRYGYLIRPTGCIGRNRSLPLKDVTRVFQRLLHSGIRPLRGGEYHSVKRSALRVHQSRGATRQETGNHNTHQRGTGFGALGGDNGHLSGRA